MSKSLKIIFNGLTFRRYPESIYRSPRSYYYVTPTHKRPGITTLHREVWKSCIGEIPHGYHIHHKDGNFDNNDISNLECISLKEHKKIHESTKERLNLSVKNKQVWQSKPKFKMFCQFCKKEFFAYFPSFTKFCSGNCTAKSRDRSKKDFLEKACMICQNMFSSRKYNGSSTCSLKCATQKAQNTKRESRKCRLMKEGDTA